MQVLESTEGSLCSDLKKGEKCLCHQRCPKHWKPVKYLFLDIYKIILQSQSQKQNFQFFLISFVQTGPLGTLSDLMVPNQTCSRYVQALQYINIIPKYVVPNLDLTFKNLDWDLIGKFDSNPQFRCVGPILLLMEIDVTSKGFNANRRQVLKVLEYAGMYKFWLNPWFQADIFFHQQLQASVNNWQNRG